MGHASRMRAVVAVGAATLFAFGTTGSANADPIGSGTASSFAATVALGGQEVIPPTPAAEVKAPPFAEDADETAIPIDASPLAMNGTFIATAAVHQASDLESTLGQEASAQEVAGPYNARAVGQIESLQVLLDQQVPGGQLLNAELVTGEAVAVCKAGAVQYSASSEVVNLQITDQDPLSGPLNTLVDEISAGINASELAQVVDIDVNVVTKTADGASVDALVITLLAAAGEAPLGQVRLGHAEVKGVACDAADAPQCSDTQDNDGDSAIDTDDPGCHTDGDATNAATYDPTDDDETNAAGALPKTTDNVAAAGALPATGSSVATGAAAALGAGALALFAVRRRLV